jgi:hypothetical protein
MKKKESVKQAGMIKAACVLFFIAGGFNALSVLLRVLSEGKVYWWGLAITLICIVLGVVFSRPLFSGKK